MISFWMMHCVHRQENAGMNIRIIQLMRVGQITIIKDLFLFDMFLKVNLEDKEPL